MKIIGIWAPAPQSGKSTIASMLVKEHRFEIVPFAGTLKEMLRVLLLNLGHSQAEITNLYRGDKLTQMRSDIPCSVRRALQTLGTEWGRELIDRELWIKAWKGNVKRVLDSPLRCEGVVVDDVRFPNEVEAIRSLGGEMWAVIRDDPAIISPHASEAMRLEGITPTRCFKNNGSVEDLLTAVRAAL